jgi:hypothetical protein
LSGAQSNAELMAFLQISDASSNEAFHGNRSPFASAAPAHTSAGYPSLFSLPLSLQQMSSLRTFDSVAPSSTASEGLTLDFDLSKLRSFLDADSPMLRAVALAHLCKSLRDRHPNIVLRRVQLGRLPPLGDEEPPENDRGPYAMPPEDDMFVRVALYYGLNLAIHIFSNPSHLDDGDSFEGAMEAYHQRVAPRTMHDLKVTLGRARLGKLSPDNMMVVPGNQHNGIASLRTSLATLAQLPNIGHYVYLFRVLKEQLFTVDPDAHATGTPNEHLVGVVTLEMVNTLTVGGLPKSLQAYLEALLRRDCRNDNVLDVFETLRTTLCDLIKGNNEILKQCDAFLKAELPVDAPRKRPCVSWLMLTIHHQVMSARLFEEVWQNRSDVTRDRLCHFDEAIVGLPEVSLEHFPLRVSKELSFQCEPKPSDAFPRDVPTRSI